jgi:hypothetical protein
MSTANETQPGMLLIIDRANSVGGATLGFDHGIKAKWTCHGLVPLL